jgi:tetratricopeptide (TPR) repeat protein
MVKFLVILLLLPELAVAAVNFEAKVDRNRVAPGDYVRLTLTLSGTFDSSPALPAPEIPGVEVTSGGTSQSYSIVNGDLRAEISATYYLRVPGDSSFVIPGLTASVGGRTYRTQPIEVTVDKQAARSGASSGTAPPGGAQAPPTAAGPQGQGAGAAVSRGGGAPGDEVFITLSADRSRAYVGQQIVLTFRFHRRVQLWDSPQYSPPRTEGFWREDLPPERTYMSVIAGHRYNITEIRYALFPTCAGRLVIEPASVEIPGDVFDRFFSFRQRRGGPRQLKTDPVPIEVLPLPQPQPADYTGIVAEQLSLVATVSRDTLPRGEPVDLVVTVDTDGFLQGMEGLQLAAPDGVRMHDSVENLSLDKSGERLLSRYRVEKVLVPLQEGPIALLPVRLTYFDPAAGRYHTAAADPGRLLVSASDLPVQGDTPETFRRSEIERLGTDLAFVHAMRSDLRERWRPYLAGPLWWLAALLPVGLLGLWRWRLSVLAREHRDPVGHRQRRALARARQELAAAGRLRGEEARLAGLARAINGYVADRTGRARAAVGTAEVRRLAEDLGQSAAGLRLAELLAMADGQRFGGKQPAATVGGGSAAARPSAVAAAPRDVVQEADRLLSQLEVEARRQGGPQGWRLLLARFRARRSGGAKHLLLLVLVLSSGLPSLALAPGLREAKLLQGLPGIVTPAAAQGSGPAGLVGEGLAVRGDPARLLAEGNEAYTRGDIDQALTRYQAALAAGANDAVVHYNLGTAHARRGELGRAIACYLRALRLDPRDGDARANLAWVRQHTQDLELAGQSLPPVISVLDRGIHLLSLDEWSIILLALVWLLCGLVAWIWWQGGAGGGQRRLQLVLACLLVSMAMILGWLWYEEQVRDRAVVVDQEVEVRSGPGESFPVVFRVHDGLVLTLQEERQGWTQVGLGGEWVGWMPAGSVERIRLDGPPETEKGA